MTGATSLKRCKLPIPKGATFTFKIIKKYIGIKNFIRNFNMKIKQNDSIIKKESFATP